jgi:plastocyanin
VDATPYGPLGKDIYDLSNGALVRRSPTVRDPTALVMLLLVSALLMAAASPASAQDANATANTTATPTPAASGTGIPADAPGPAAKHITRILTIGVLDADCPAGAPSPCFDVTKLAANPGDSVVLRGDFTNSDTPHNLDAKIGLTTPVKSKLAPNAVHTISFLMPDGKVTVVCDAHATMTLSFVHPADAASAGGEVAIPGLGVHFLAYWVGVIAFMLLFVVYGATFFLFKYNETNATTDHWDRADPSASRPGLSRTANLLALVIAVVAVAAIVYFATR